MLDVLKYEDQGLHQAISTSLHLSHELMIEETLIISIVQSFQLSNLISTSSRKGLGYKFLSKALQVEGIMLAKHGSILCAQRMTNGSLEMILETFTWLKPETSRRR